MKKTYIIKYYGMIAEAMGKETEIVELDLAVQTDARKIFTSKFQKLEKLPFQVATDTEIVERFTTTDFKVISLLPPFSGR